jgi:hypothetical protein
MLIRFQRRRIKGWRKPEGAVYVGRGSKWGNPYKVERSLLPEHAVSLFEQHMRLMKKRDPKGYAELLAPLRGKNLMCWCPIDAPCHADVLIRLANA